MLNRLTERAKTAILGVSQPKNKSNSSASDVIGSIKASGGVGTYILENNPGLKLKTSKHINLNDLVEKAYYHSASLQHLYVGTEHLLLALLEITGSPDVENVKKQITSLSSFPNFSQVSEFTTKTPLLDAFGTNLNKDLSSAMPVYREEVELLISVLLQKENANPLVIGDFGVGKKSLVELLVHKLNAMEVPVALAGYQIIEFDVISFIANLSNREGIEAGITTLLEELDTAGDVILYIKDFQSLFIGTNVGFAVPLAFSMLKSYLSTAGVSILGIVNSTFYERLAGEATQILDNFEEIHLEEPEEPKIKAVLKAKAQELSRYHNIRISPEILNYAFRTAKSNIKDTKFRQGGISLLDQACTKLLLKKDLVPVKYKRLIKKKNDLNKQITQHLELGAIDDAMKARGKLAVIETGLDSTRHTLLMTKPLELTTVEIDEVLADMGVSRIDSGFVDLESLSNLSKRIKEKIVGQDAAVETVSRALIRSRLGLRAKKRPLGNFLFLGPTGVGKTELAKVLAEAAFGDENLIRLDMSDFGEKHTVARLVGAPPGYVGYGEGGELTSKIDNMPDSVVLFDEIEKAHPDVLNILLQITEEGELVDAKGQSHDFSQAVVVLTSNLGTDIVLSKDIGFSGGRKSDDEVEGRLRENLKKIMKPELLNRFDEIVVFKRLSKKEQITILELLLAEIYKTLKAQQISLTVAASVKRHLLEKGYNDEYGARALRRTVETKLLDKVAEFLLKNPQRPLRLKASFSRQISITL